MTRRRIMARKNIGHDLRRVRRGDGFPQRKSLKTQPVVLTLRFGSPCRWAQGNRGDDKQWAINRQTGRKTVAQGAGMALASTTLALRRLTSDG